LTSLIEDLDKPSACFRSRMILEKNASQIAILSPIPGYFKSIDPKKMQKVTLEAMQLIKDARKKTACSLVP
jgi:hypothetical protein